jgi:hypothetical protein
MILGLIIIGIAIVLGIGLMCSDDDGSVFIVILVLFGAIGGMLLGGSIGKDAGRKEGQIEILTGSKPSYHLVTKPDSTKTWEEISK